MITIRPATNEDRAFIKRMIWEAILASPTFIGEIGLPRLQAMEDQHWAAWDCQTEPSFIASNDTGEDLGVVALKVNLQAGKTIIGWQFGIGVRPDCRQQGVGQRLIERAIDYTRESGAQYLTLYVDPANQTAIRLYRKLGFVNLANKNSLMEMRLVFAQPTLD